MIKAIFSMGSNATPINFNFTKRNQRKRGMHNKTKERNRLKSANKQTRVFLSNSTPGCELLFENLQLQQSHSTLFDSGSLYCLG